MNNVPNLRFKEFSEDWNLTNLRQVTNGFEYGMNAAATEFDGENKYIRITDIDESTSKYLNDNVVSPLGGLEDKYLVKQNDILFARTGASTGKTYLYNHKDGKLYFAGFLIRANINSDNNSKFIFLQTKTRAYNNWVQIMSMRSGQPGINSQEYASYSFYAPSKQEQEKIASFFSLIDKKIELQTEKVEELKNYKKGIMQKIFSQELRLKDENGNEYPEWEEEKLGNICDYKNGKTYEEFICENGQYNLISLNSIGIDGKLKKEHKKVNVCDDFLIKGDLIMVLSDVAHGNFLGLTDIIPTDNIYVLNQRMGALRRKVDIDVEWLSKYINYNQRYFKLHGQGSSQLNLSKADILNFKVLIPCLKEQTKIAKVLWEIDIKIEKEQEKLEYLNQYKKGLLQQMFV